MKIRQIWTVFCRELWTYFNTVIGYVFMIAFLFLSVGLYMNSFFAVNRIEIRSFFENMPLILAVFLPAISMRLWSEDRRGNTLELLLTLPLSVTSIMLGKFFAALAFFAFTLIGTLSVPVLLYSLGSPDSGPILGAYIGTLLLAAYYLALGTFLSGFFKDQIVAFVLTLICCIALWISSTDYFAIFLDGSWQSLQLGTFLKEYVGIRFQNLSKGLLHFGDVAYFVLFSAAFLYLNQLLIGHRRPLRSPAFIGISVLVLGSTLFGNACLTRLSLPKTDLTQNQLFTLSPSSKKILQSLEFPISLHFYINEKDSLPTDMRGLEQNVIDLLSELKQASLKENKYYLNYFINHPRIPPKIPQGHDETLQKLQVQEAEVLSPEEIHRRHLEQEKLRYETERLQWKGITPFPKQTVEADTMEIRDVYSGIAISYLDELEEVVNPLTPGMLDQLEYELMNRIQKLMKPRPRILVYAPREEDTPQNQFLRNQGMAVPPPRDPFKGIIDYLSEFHQYQVVRFDFDRPFDGDLLILFQPEGLNSRQKYEISRALASGKSVWIANQSVLYDFRRYYEAHIPIWPSEKDLDELLENYGFKTDPRMLLDENAFTARLYNDVPGFEQAKEFHIPFPIHVLVAKKNQHPQLLMMKGFSNLPMAYASVIDMNVSKMKDLGLKFELLCTSSKNSWLYRPKENKLTVAALTSQKSAEDTGEYPLAILVTGQFPDLFANKPRPSFPKKDPSQTGSAETLPEAPQTPLEKKPGKLILVGSSAMFSPEYPHSPQFQDILTFFKNTLDYLTLGDEIIQIRTKNTAVQKIDPSMKPAEKSRKKNLTLFLVPGFVILFGILRFSLRSIQKKRYRLQLLAQKRSAP